MPLSLRNKQKYLKMNRNSKLMNFLDVRLSKYCEISSDGVSDDYYCLGNLISTDVTRRNLGFMTVSFAKPPIEITIKFKWKVDLKYLKVYSELSSLKSTKFQVFVHCLNFENQEILRKIGDISLEDKHRGFCLKLHDNLESPDDTLKTESIYPYARKSVKAIDFLKIVIQDTKLRRAPVIKSIEVLGIPSWKNSQKDNEYIEKLWNADKASKSENSDTISSEKPGESSESLENSFHIPEEFLDAITQDLLVMPFVLPSGNVIDETTLEKHKKHEETYGRLPSDPFTGIIFTSDSQPKFDSALKVRLDDFKMRNSHEIEIKESGRTTGKRITEPVASTSGYNSHISKKIKLNQDSKNLDDLISSIYRNNQVSVFTKPKDTGVEENRWKCSTCEELGSTLYRISTCSHLFCKPCLLKLENACGNCQEHFELKDVVKVHL